MEARKDNIIMKYKKELNRIITKISKQHNKNRSWAIMWIVNNYEVAYSTLYGIFKNNNVPKQPRLIEEINKIIKEFR